MRITINDTPVDARANETLLEAARRAGYDIPSLCYAKGAKHQSSCMVCAVRNAANGQIIPSCSTLPVEGMRIETACEEVKHLRRLSLELLLSDHRADCEAPCSIVCAGGLDVEKVLACYDDGQYAEAHAIIAAVFALPVIGCDTCKAPCEKACRRGTVDNAVPIRCIIKEIAEMSELTPSLNRQPVEKPAGNAFRARLGRFTEKEKERLRTTVTTPSGCLHCACAGYADCKLRLHAAAENIKLPRYEASSALPAMERVQVTERLVFEAAKCIRCGLCVYNTANGFTFRDRGFGMQVVIPEENRADIREEVAALCPTGALYLRAAKQMIIMLLACLLVACTGGSDSGGSGNMDWKLFRGDASLSGYTTVSLPKEPVLKWTFRSETRTVSSPVIDNGTTYWCDKTGRVRGIDINGQPVFEYDLQTPVEATPMINDSTLYIGRIDGIMSAISLKKKSISWNYETMGQLSASPNLVEYGGRKSIVFGSYDNYLYCVDAVSGEERGRYESGYYLNGAAAIWKHYVIFGGCDAWVRIVDCRSGARIDSLLLDAYVPASPAIMGDYCYIGDYAGNIYKLMLENGKIVRHKKIVSENAENGSFVSVPAIATDAYYFFSGDRYLHSISRINGKPNWKYLLKGNTGESSPVVCDDKILVCTKSGIVSILDANSGRLLWEYDTGEQIVGSPAVIRHHFMILTTKGTLFCFI